MRRATFVLLIGVLLLATVGAGAADPVKLRIAMYRGNATWDEVEAFYNEFTKEYPHVELELTNVYGGSVDQMTVETLGGVAADVFATWSQATVLSMQRGFTLDLIPLLERDGMLDLIDDMLPATIELMSMDGGLYGLPQYQAVGAMFYNRDLLEEGGIPDIDGSWDWHEFAEIVKKLTRFDGDEVVRTGYGQFGSWISYFPWFEQAGVNFADDRHLPFDSSEAIETMEFLQDLYNSGFIQLAGIGELNNRETAMTHSGAWELTHVTQSGIPLGIAAPPQGAGGRSTLANTDVVSISRQTQHVEEAWTFVKWLYRSDIQRKYQQLKGLQPARMSLVPFWIEDVQDLFEAHGMPRVHGMQAFLENSAFASHQPYFADASVVSDIESTLNEILEENVPPALALVPLTERVNQRLKEAE